MALITLYDTDLGVNRLLTSLLDTGGHAAWYSSDRSYDSAAEVYRELFDAYVPALQQAYDEAAPWWEDTVAAQRAEGLSEQTAVETAFNIRMAGAAADPRVVWIVRLIWLECADINSGMPDAAKIRPEYLMVQWLKDAGETELVRLLACMPYWPIGMNEDGEWC